MKTCPKCGQEKDVSEFTSCSKSKDGYFYCCKSCKKEYKKENPENLKERFKRFRENNPDYFKDYYQRYTKEYEIRNPEKKAARKRLYCESGKNAVSCQGRRSRQLGLDSSFTLAHWEDVKQFFHNSCAYCGKEGNLQQEHFVAMNRKGEYSHKNIIPACQKCNQSKGRKDFFIWYPDQTFYSKRREKKILRYLNYSE